LGQIKNHSTGTKTVGGYWKTGNSIESVQVKGWSCSRVARYKGGTFLRIPIENPPNNLLVILFYSHLGEYEVLYSGRADSVGFDEKNGKARVVRLNLIKTKSDIDRILNKITESRKTNQDNEMLLQTVLKEPIKSKDNQFYENHAA
jgi:hypothetical protein